MLLLSSISAFLLATSLLNSGECRRDEESAWSGESGTNSISEYRVTRIGSKDNLPGSYGYDDSDRTPYIDSGYEATLEELSYSDKVDILIARLNAIRSKIARPSGVPEYGIAPRPGRKGRSGATTTLCFMSFGAFCFYDD